MVWHHCKENDRPNFDNLLQTTTPAYCAEMVKKSFDSVNKNILPMCNDMSGKIDSLIINSDLNVQRNTTNYPIDMVVTNMIRGDEINEDVESNKEDG